MERRAFTLIEMMIAVALGAMVVYVAAAGFRGASQAVTAANRLALDNAIMRAGVGIALNEKDFWLNVDDPFDLNNTEGRQPLRANPTAGTSSAPPRGLPFTPFASAASAGIYARTTDTYDSARPWIPAEEAGGWSPNAWNANESRGWAWGNLNERIPYIHSKPDKTQTFGRYHLYSRPETTAAHHWQQRQLEGLKNSLGFYGLFDYLPANTPLMAYERNGSSWSVSREWCFVGPADNSTKDVNYIGNDNRREGFNFANDILYATNGNPFIIPNAKPTTGTITQIAYKRYAAGISLSMSSNNSSISNIGNILNDGMYLVDWLPQRPAHWPSLQVSSLRFIRTNSFVCMNRVIWTSPLTGQPTELNFTAFGTTLRGARQQRHLTQRGWSDPFVADPSESPNLDTY